MYDVDNSAGGLLDFVVTYSNHYPTLDWIEFVAVQTEGCTL